MRECTAQLGSGGGSTKQRERGHHILAHNDTGAVDINGLFCNARVNNEKTVITGRRHKNAYSEQGVQVKCIQLRTALGQTANLALHFQGRQFLLAILSL